MYKKVFRILALTLFALLQTAVPLLHAHVGPPHSSGIHMHVALPTFLDAGKAQQVQSVRLADSPAIEVGDMNKKRDVVTLDAPATITRAGPAPPVAMRDEPHGLDHQFAIQHASRFTLPPAHAPPRIAT